MAGSHNLFLSVFPLFLIFLLFHGVSAVVVPLQTNATSNTWPIALNPTLTAPMSKYPWPQAPFLYPPKTIFATTRLFIQRYNPSIFNFSQRVALMGLIQYWQFQIKRSGTTAMQELIPWDRDLVLLPIQKQDPTHDVEVVFHNVATEKGNAYTYWTVYEMLTELDLLITRTGEAHFGIMVPQIIFPEKSFIYKSFEVRKRISTGAG